MSERSFRGRIVVCSTPAIACKSSISELYRRVNEVFLTIEYNELEWHPDLHECFTL